MSNLKSKEYNSGYEIMYHFAEVSKIVGRVRQNFIKTETSKELNYYATMQKLVERLQKELEKIAKHRKHIV